VRRVQDAAGIRATGMVGAPTERVLARRDFSLGEKRVKAQPQAPGGRDLRIRRPSVATQAGNMSIASGEPASGEAASGGGD